MTTQHMRWTILELMGLVIIVAIGVAAYKYFWVSSEDNYSLVFGTYLWFLTLATLAARVPGQRLRRSWLGYAAFGWAYLLFVLRGGYGIETFAAARRFSSDCLLGMVLGLLAALAAVWVLPVPAPALATPPTPLAEPPVGGLREAATSDQKQVF